MKVQHFLSTFTGICLLFCTLQLKASIWYVKPTGNDTLSGASWTQAFASIQKAINTAAVGDEVWVAAGSYAPTKTQADFITNPRERMIQIQKDIKIYGGFAGNETNLNERDWVNNVTIFTGVPTNAYHVVRTSKVTNACVVDGFTITGGNADGTSGVVISYNRAGAGWYNDGELTFSSPTIVHCIFKDNYANSAGAAWANNGIRGTANPVFIDCVFDNNTAAVAGGAAVYSESSFGTATPTFTDCIFKNNHGYHGGAIFDNATDGFSNLLFTGCSFLDNVATNDGGAVYSYNNEGDCRISFEACKFTGNQCGSFGSALNLWTQFGNISSVMTNCIFTGNVALGAVIYHQHMNGSGTIDINNCTIAGNTGGKAVINLETTLSITNSIVWGNNSDIILDPSFINYSNVPTQYHSYGTGNISANPGFLNLAAGDVRLNDCSSSVDTGTDTDAPATDFEGNLRPQGNSVDMGAFERAGLVFACAASVVYLNADGTASLPASELSSNSSGCGNLTFTVDGSNTLHFDCDNLGIYGVTLQVTDEAGRSGNCNTLLFVADTVAPVLNCLFTHVVPAGGNNCSGVVGNLTPTSVTDNCTGSPEVVQLTPPSTPLVGLNASITVTLKATDGLGNSSTCNIIVQLVDQSPPIVLCKNASVILDGFGVGNITASQVFQSGSDNCGSVFAQSVSPFSFDCSNLGANTVVLSAHDGNGNTTTCHATVTVIDNAAPTVTCKNFTAYLSDNGAVTVNPVDVFQGGVDNCGLVNLASVSPNAFQCNNLGNHSVTLTANDGHGNTASCNASVTVVDNIAPVVVCKPFAVNLNASGACTITPGNVFQSGSDNCGAVNVVSVLPNAFSCSNLGVNTVILTANDGHGNTNTCAATVTVVDNIAPVVVCKPFTLNLNGSGTGNLLTDNVFQSGSDNCGTVNTISVLPNAFTCSNLGANTVTLTVDDSHGNTNSCTATVTVRDVTIPTLICRNVSLNLDANGQATLTIVQVNNGSYDNCAIMAYALSKTDFTCANLGANAIELSGFDASGNKGFCTAVITVADPLMPVAKCKNVIANLGTNGTVTVDPSLVNNGSTDNCSFTMALIPYAFTCSNTGTNNVQFRVTDSAGNSASCSAVVTIRDVTAPVAQCKNAIITLNSTGQATLTVNDLNNGSSDACGIATMTLSKTQFNCSDLNGSPQTVIMTVKDIHNNVSSCNALVTTKDLQAPTAVCHNTTVHLGSNGTVTVYPAILASDSYDNCSVWSYSPSAKTYTTANLGNNNLIITVKDWSGNAATCISVVTVQAYSNFGSDEIQERMAVKEPATARPEIRLYPNPAIDACWFEFELPAANDYQVTIVDPAGKIVLTQEGQGSAGQNTIPVRLNEVPSGIYLVELRCAGWRETRRLVLTK